MLMLKIGLALVLAALLLFLAGRVLERALLYFPDKTHTLPAAVGLANVAEVVLANPDGNKVIAWWGKATPGQPTVLYFHGNGGSLAGRADRIQYFLDHGRGIMMMTYRGYGGSTGAPSEKANVADALLAFDTLVAKGVWPEDVILYGESLGSGIAVQVAAARQPGGLILDAPYTSIIDVGAGAYPFLPVRLLMRDRYETLRFIGLIHCPLLVIHGDEDRVIPVEMGRVVFAAAPEPKDLVILHGAGHVPFESIEAADRWIATLVSRPRGSSRPEESIERTSRSRGH